MTAKGQKLLIIVYRTCHVLFMRINVSMHYTFLGGESDVVKNV